MTWNIDSGRINEKENILHTEFPEWHIQQRLPFIFKEIEEINPDLLHIQEARKTNDIDSFYPLIVFLTTKMNYDVATSQYGETEKVGFHFITAYKKHLVLLKTITFPISTEIYIPLFGIELLDTTTNTMFYSLNIHLSVNQEKRNLDIQKLNLFLENLLQEQSSQKIILAGDFNSFANSQGKEQIKNVLHLKELTTNLVLPNGDDINTSFICFPYDFGAEKENLPKNISTRKEIFDTLSLTNPFGDKLLGTNLIGEYPLDHIFVLGFNTTTIPMLKVTPCFPTLVPNIYTFNTIREYIHQCPGPAFASDHQPIVISLL